MFVKLTFMLQFASLVLLLFAQLLRFLIWSLTLINFLKSGIELVSYQPVSNHYTGNLSTDGVDQGAATQPAVPALRRISLKMLHIFTWIGVALFGAYAVFLIFQQ